MQKFNAGQYLVHTAVQTVDPDQPSRTCFAANVHVEYPGHSGITTRPQSRYEMHDGNQQAAAIDGTRRLGLLAGIIAFIAMIAAPTPAGLPDIGWSVAAVAALMMIWWMSEAVPLAVTALVPIALLPVLGVKPLEAVAGSYAHPLVFLFLGGFLIAKALERWDLHRRIAAAVIRVGPQSSSGLIASLMLTTAFLSMWISNTATAMVMVPIAQSLIVSLRSGTAALGECDDFATALMLGIAFSATIGGMATLIGTPPNALLAGYVQTAHGISIGFAQWMLLGVPIVAVLLPVTWFILTRVVFDVGGLAARTTEQPLSDAGSRQSAHSMAKSLPASFSKPGRLSTGAKLTAVVITIAGLALISRPFVSIYFPFVPLSDAGIAVTAALVLFATSTRSPNRERLLSWDDAKTIRWDVLILFGGGLALAAAIDSSGLSHAIGHALSSLSVLPIALVVLVAMTVIVYLGELASNTAIAAVFLPIASAVAVGFGVPPLDLVLPIGLAASLGFMLPVATPPNAIVYGSGEVGSQQMLKTGAVLDVVAILVVYCFALTLGHWLFR